MKQYEVKYSDNPQFQTITGLTNTTYNSETSEETRMATEAQIQEIKEKIMEIDSRRNYCCRDIVVWHSYVRIVDTNRNVISPFIDNMAVGTARRGIPFTVTFNPKWSADKFMPFSTSGNNEEGYNGDGGRSFLINVNTYNTNTTYSQQSQREIVDKDIKNSLSVQTSSANNAAMYDIAYTNNSYVTNLTVYCNKSIEDCGLPQYGKDKHFYIYMKEDGTLSVDVLARFFYGGVENYNLDNPSYLGVFWTQFVLRDGAML